MPRSGEVTTAATLRALEDLGWNAENGVRLAAEQARRFPLRPELIFPIHESLARQSWVVTLPAP